MVQDYRDGRGEEDIVQQVAFALPDFEARQVLHAARLTHDALDALRPWMREPDGVVSLIPHTINAPDIAVTWPTDEPSRRRRLIAGLDNALWAADIGYRARPPARQPLAEADLIEGASGQLYFVSTPELLESLNPRDGRSVVTTQQRRGPAERLFVSDQRRAPSVGPAVRC